MADSYCESSSMFEIPRGKEDKAKEILESISGQLMEENDYVGYKADFEDMGDGQLGLWIRHDESINPEDVELLAKALVEGLEIDEPFFFSWSYTCSKPRINEFGGGACAVKRGLESRWFDANSLAHEAFV